MNHEMSQHEPVFTKSGALLGFVAYVVVAVIIMSVYL